jgi:hypothetical protein
MRGFVANTPSFRLVLEGANTPSFRHELGCWLALLSGKLKTIVDLIWSSWVLSVLFEWFQSCGEGPDVVEKTQSVEHHDHSCWVLLMYRHMLKNANHNVEFTKIIRKVYCSLASSSTGCFLLRDSSDID